MNETITGRDELLLAKIAGKNVDLSTMTPSVAMNKKEKLLLEIADRLDNFKIEGILSNAEPFVLTGILKSESENHLSVTLDKTAEEVYEALVAGKVTVFKTKNGNGPAIESVIQLSCNKVTTGDDAVYQFWFTNEDNWFFVSATLASDDVVKIVGSYG